MMNKKVRVFFETYLTRKIGAEIKCCLTFFLILCFYCTYRLIVGFNEASIIYMVEMVIAAYVLQWIQILLQSDFDEVDRLSIKEWLLVLVGSAVYTCAGHFANWFDMNIAVCIGFFVYMVCCYLCTFLIYKIKRVIDAKHLNEDLKIFKERNNKIY